MNNDSILDEHYKDHSDQMHNLYNKKWVRSKELNDKINNIIKTKHYLAKRKHCSKSLLTSLFSNKQHDCKLLLTESVEQALNIGWFIHPYLLIPNYLVMDKGIHPGEFMRSLQSFIYELKTGRSIFTPTDHDLSDAIDITLITMTTIIVQLINDMTNQGIPIIQPPQRYLNHHSLIPVAAAQPPRRSWAQRFGMGVGNAAVAAGRLAVKDEIWNDELRGSAYITGP